MEVTVHQAKSQLSRLLKIAQGGETVTIIRRGIPVARLTPLPPPGERRLGWDPGPGAEAELRPMSDDEAEAFLEGR